MYRLGDLLNLLLLTAISFLSFAGCVVVPANQESIDWRTGSELDRGVRIGISGQWTDAPIYGLLQQLARQQRIALFIDRRIDPSAKVNLSVRDSTWEQLLMKIGQPHEYFFCRIEDIYYFGPRETCLTLPVVYENLREELLKRRNDLKVNWRRPVQTNWPRLSQPSQILASLGRENDIELISLNQITHDLWREFDSPSIPLMLKTILLTTGFDKTVAVSQTGSKMKIVDYPQLKKCSWVVEHLDNAKSAMRKIQNDHAKIRMRAVSRERVEMSGPNEPLYAAVVALLAQQHAIGGQGPGKYTFELKGTRGTGLATVANQLNVELVYGPDEKQRLSEYIERNFKHATAEEIIHSVLQETGLSYRLDDKKLTIK